MLVFAPPVLNETGVLESASRELASAIGADWGFSEEAKQGGLHKVLKRPTSFVCCRIASSFTSIPVIAVLDHTLPHMLLQCRVNAEGHPTDCAVEDFLEKK